jgi:superfamily II RNA helicase
MAVDERQAVVAGSVGRNGRTPTEESLRALEQEIASGEAELQQLQGRMRALQAQIHHRYHGEIERIRELSELHKAQQRAKKDKRREQKKRGKNYREPTGVLNTKAASLSVQSPGATEATERKKLYREAIVQVHPDKFVNQSSSMNARSEELTIALIDIYQSGNLDKLRLMHRLIMSGNALTPGEEGKAGGGDPHAVHCYLVGKRDELREALANARQSRIYEVLTTYSDPLTFLDELSAQFTLRIQQLERRTRRGSASQAG